MSPDRGWIPHEDIDDDVDIFIGAIIRYGDYGTSPRYGWIDEKHETNVLSILNDELEEWKERANNTNIPTDDESEE